MGLMGREAAVAITSALQISMTAEEYMTSSQEIMNTLFTNCTILPGQIDEKGAMFFVVVVAVVVEQLSASG